MKFTSAIRAIQKGEIVGRKYPVDSYSEYLFTVENAKDYTTFVYRYLPYENVAPITENVWYICDDPNVIEYVRNLREKSL